MLPEDVFFPLIDEIIVDLKSILSVQHSCVPKRCNTQQCCCHYYEITINRTELYNIISAMPQASQYSQELKTDNGYENLFETIDKSTYTIDKDDKGVCSFAYYSKDQKILCSLHSAATEMKMPIKYVKPLSCIIWPLAFFESDPLVLSVQENVSLFCCNKKNTSSGHTLDSGIAQNLEMAFGGAFLNKIKKSLRNIKCAL